MQIPFTGQCECGGVKFHCNAQPLAMYNCHCKGCQTRAYAGYMALIVMKPDEVAIEGVTKKTGTPTEGDQHGQRFCCAKCGDAFFATSTMPDILLIDAERLDETDSFEPVADIWTVDADPAVVMDTHIPKVWTSPPLIGRQDAI